MENVMNTFKKYSAFFGIFALAMSLNSCSDDDDGNVMLPDPSASIEADAQFVSGNTIEVSSVEVESDAWLVVRRVNEDGSFSEIIADPVFLEEGSHSNIVIELDNSNATDVEIENGDQLIVMLHQDDGDGVFEYQGTSGADALLTDANGSGISSTFMISAPNFSIADQEVSENSITFDNVNSDEDAWIVVHNSDESGAISESEIVGWTFVPAGDNSNVIVTFNENFVYTPGQTIWSRVYMDNPADGAFTYIDDPATDMPARFGFSEDGTISSSIVIN